MKSNSEITVAVIGAGPAGMTAAYALARKGVRVHVYEAGPQVGGLARSLTLWNQTVDLGPHRFFSTDKRVNDLWLEVVGNEYKIVDRLTRIYYRGKFFHYPLRALNALSQLGIITASHCMLSYAAQKFTPKQKGESFEAWVVNRFGRKLFDIFFRSYSEKLWGIPCSQLDADFAAQRIKKLSLMEAIKNAFSTATTSHKTLVEQFAYPTKGTGMVYEKMKIAVEAKGNKVYTDTPVQHVIVQDNLATGIELKDGTIKTYNHIISTMPISLLVARMAGVPDAIQAAAASLQFRNTILVYLKVESSHVFPDNWLYIHSPELHTGRITNFRNWVPELCGDETASILVLEYWCYDKDEIWDRADDELIMLAKSELKKTGLIKNEVVSDGYVHRIKRCYPVYDLGYKKRLKPVERHLSAVGNLSVIGRYGAFKYNNQDHSILMGLLAAENITHHTSHNLWEINTDYEEYQEHSVITAPFHENQS